MQSNNKIISGFDLLKFLMALVIINIHLRLNTYASGTHFMIAWNYINELAVPIFFVLSSFFLFKKMRLGTHSENKKNLINYEVRLTKLYLFWIVALSPIILYSWHPEYLDSPLMGMALFVKNFFFAYEFGASWFFGALLLGVPLVYITGRIFNEKNALVLSLVVYIYLYCDIDEKYLIQLYTEILRTPRLSFPAGLFWLSVGAILSHDKIMSFVVRNKLKHFISGGVIFIILGIFFHHYDYLFRIPTVLCIIFSFWKINIRNMELCKKMRIYSIHFFCLHYSIIVCLQQFPSLYFDNVIFLGFETIILCYMISNLIIYAKQLKKMSWLKYSY